MPRLAALALLLALAPGPPRARAQLDAGPDACTDIPLRAAVTVTPASGALGVSTNAPVRVLYAEGYFGLDGPGDDPRSLITVERCASTFCDPTACADGARAFVPGRVQVVGDELVFYPDARWDAGGTYAGVARGVDRDLEFTFCTGSGVDTEPPVLGEITEVTSTPRAPDCTAPEGGYRIGVFFPPAQDFDGPPGSIDYLLFQTRGVGLDGPLRRSRARNFNAEQITMTFVLPPDEATDPICVTVAAVDGVGNVDADTRAVCIDPIQGNFFQALCAAAPAAPGGAAGGWLLVPAILLAARRRR